MDTPEGFSDAMDVVEEYLERAGEDVVESGEIEPAVGTPHKGFLVQHGPHALRIEAEPDNWHFDVVYQHTVFETFAKHAAIPDSVGDDIEPGEEIEIEVELNEQHLEQAIAETERILDNQDDEKKETLRQKFARMLSTPTEGLSYQLFHLNHVIDTDVSGVVGLETRSRIWPYEEDFSPSDVHQACQAVVSNGLPVTVLLHRQFGLQGGMQDLAASAGMTTPDDRDTRAFQ